MSLFVCQKCKTIDNTATCSVDYSPTVYTGMVEDENLFFPNMGGQDMDGQGDEDILLNGVVWKRKDEVKRLCCYCNTGKWHGEFARNYASEDDLKVAKYSKYNMITPFDHEGGSIVKVANNSEDYVVLGSYEAMHTIFRDLFDKTYTDHMGDFKDNLFQLAYKVYKEDPMNFVPASDGKDIDWNNRRSVGLWIMDSLVYEDESKSDTLIENFNEEFDFSRNPYARGRTGPVKKFLDRVRKPHWKLLQSKEDKETKLAAAEAKRLRKQNKDKRC